MTPEGAGRTVTPVNPDERRDMTYPEHPTLAEMRDTRSAAYKGDAVARGIIAGWHAAENHAACNGECARTVVSRTRYLGRSRGMNERRGYIIGPCLVDVVIWNHGPCYRETYSVEVDGVHAFGGEVHHLTDGRPAVTCLDLTPFPHVAGYAS